MTKEEIDDLFADPIAKNSNVLYFIEETSISSGGLINDVPNVKLEMKKILTKDIYTLMRYEFVRKSSSIPIVRLK